jgi:hypothetical protein
MRHRSFHCSVGAWLSALACLGAAACAVAAPRGSGQSPPTVARVEGAPRATEGAASCVVAFDSLRAVVERDYAGFRDKARGRRRPLRQGDRARAGPHRHISRQTRLTRVDPADTFFLVGTRMPASTPVLDASLVMVALLVVVAAVAVYRAGARHRATATITGGASRGPSCACARRSPIR